MPHASWINTAGYSHPGPNRARNEDAWLLPPLGATEDPRGVLLVVADGVGGLTGGAEASQAAVAHLHALYYAGVGPSHLADRLREAVEGVNALNRLAQRRTQQTPGFLTTLVAAVVLSNQIWIANLGDSRAYLIQTTDRPVKQLSEDHNNSVRLAKAGAQPQATKLRNRSSDSGSASALTRAIGLDDACQVDIYHYTWEPGNALVLCSDGLAAVPMAEMAKIALAHAPERAAVELVQRALQLDGSDNCTAIVARCLARG